MSGCNCQSHRNEDVECRLERLEHQMTSWLDYIRWPREAISDLQRDAIAIRMTLQEMKTTGETNLKEIREMAVREDAAWEKNAADLASVKEGWDALVASNTAKDGQIVALQAALDAANAGTDAAVQAALDVDSDADAGKVEAANAALESLLAAPVEPPVEA